MGVVSCNLTQTTTSIDSRSNTSATIVPSAVDYDSSSSVDDFDWKSGTARKRFSISWARGRRQAKSGPSRQIGPKGLSILHRPPEPLVDIIFVHGLRGGSIKTWQKGGDPQRFWPHLWLSVEPGFEHANIHSYGYDADITTGNGFNIHDFGRELLEEMRTNPHLTDDEERPIIMLGHSMGGLVIKKAFILSQDIPTWKHRIRAIVFLATPHRGSNYASILKNILTVSGIAATRQYVADLTTSSQTLKLINDDFGKRAHDIAIYSFFETLKTKVGPSSLLIVDKDSAILGSGFRNERVKSAAANHCNISKFKNPEEPTYNLIRNALAMASKDLLKDVLVLKAEEARAQMKALKPYLEMHDAPEEHHDTVDGSCEWIEARDDFQDWRQPDELDMSPTNVEFGPASNSISIFWIYANPGSGKTFLASYVQSQLESTKLQCAYYYFHVGNQTSRSLAPFLRSIAYQMAASSTAVRDKLYKMYQDGSVFDVDDAWAVWTKLFKKGIFQIESDIPQYWIIDAIDECPRYAEFFTMLKGEKPHFPLRIFITSRPIRDMQRLHKPLQPTTRIQCIEIPGEDCYNDIRCYVKSRVDGMSLEDSASATELIDTILRKSNACFLWVRLVLDELENVFTTVSRMEILNTIPEGMKPYYERVLEPIQANGREKHISKALFTWIIAATRQLKIEELTEALQCDISMEVAQSAAVIKGLCGQLVDANQADHTVDFIHPTAREFLLSSGGEFAVSSPRAHERIALVCLKLLSGNEMRPPRTTRSISQARSTLSPLTCYAIENFSDHVFAASSENDEVLIALDRFLKTNVFSWIERVAMTGSHYVLLRVCKNLRAYLDRRAKYHSPLSSEVRNIEGWATDLNRLITQFGEPLLTLPSSIYCLIPPMCPSNTAVSRQFGKRVDALVLHGERASVWDDCIASIEFREDIASAVSCGEQVFAVGMESGIIKLFNQRTFQDMGTICHEDPIDLVHIADDAVLTCTTEALIYQDLNGVVLWDTQLHFRCLYLAASETHVIGISQHGHLIKWDKSTGKITEDVALKYQNHDVETMHNHGTKRAPQVATISPDFEMVALGYRGGTVSLWDSIDIELIGWAKDEEGRVAAKLMFNPNPGIHLLLVIYSNHGMALYDTWSTELVQSHESPNNAGILSASCSPDGRTLATTDTNGNMNIWDFETLSVLYYVNSPFPSFRILNFTTDGSSILDVMDSSMRVWSPSVLVRKTFEEDASISDDVVPLPVAQGAHERDMHAKIAVVATHPKLPLAVAAKVNKSVVAFTIKDGKTSELYKHTNNIVKLKISSDGIVVSSDASNVIRVQRYNSSTGQLASIEGIDRKKFESRVKQLCFSLSGKFLLVSTLQKDILYRCEDGSSIGSWVFQAGDRIIWNWVAARDPGSGEEQFWLVSDRKLKRYSAQSFPAPIDSSEATLNYQFSEGWVETEMTKAIWSPTAQALAIEMTSRLNATKSSAIFIFNTADIKWNEPLKTPVQLTDMLPCGPRHNRHILGWNADNSSMLFISGDDWVCSVSMREMKEGIYHRHFYVPSQLCGDLAPEKTSSDDVILCNAGQLTSVSNGVKFKYSSKWYEQPV